MVRGCSLVTGCLFLVLVEIKCSVTNGYYGDDEGQDKVVHNYDHKEHEHIEDHQEGKSHRVGHNYDNNKHEHIEDHQEGKSQEHGDYPEQETLELTEEQEAWLNEMDTNITNIRTKVGKMYSQNSAMLHKLSKLDDYIKRGTDMETRYLIEILGYPFDAHEVPPEVFLEHLSVELKLNFTQKQVTGLRILGGHGPTDTRLIVEFACARVKKAWLNAYKQKLYQISWGDAEKAFGKSKETYKLLVHKTVYLQDFLPTLCEMYFEGAVRFAINDYLSPYRKKLLSYSKLLAAHYKWRFVWVNDGDIFVRRKNNEKGYYIRAERDFRAFDWRLENEEFFWKTINECNKERRQLMRHTTRRILAWMTTRDWVEETRWTEFTDSLLVYKRKFDDQMRDLLQKVTIKFKIHDGYTDRSNKYNFLTIKLNLNKTMSNTTQQIN
ncbi:hypothetical protein WDU94_012109 [Cyamophila willieti]